jgi:hypothetical protein
VVLETHLTSPCPTGAQVAPMLVEVA